MSVEIPAVSDSHSQGDMTPVLPPPEPLNYSDYHFLKNSRNTVTESLDWLLSSIGRRSPQKEPIEGGGRQVLFIDGRQSGRIPLNPLAEWFEKQGFEPIRSGVHLGDSLVDPTPRGLAEVDQMEPGGILLGHSFGGAFARRLARLRPDTVTHVVELAGPKLGIVNGISFDESADLPPQVRSTNFVSRADPIVGERHSRSTRPGADVEVHTSHLGYATSREVRSGLVVALQPRDDLYVAGRRNVPLVT